MKKICFIAQFPPPMHGLSKAVETLYNSNLNFEIDSQGEFEFEKVDITNNKNFIKNLLKISRSKADLFYFTISQTKGGNLRDLVIFKLLELQHKKCLIHLHGGYYRQLVDNDMAGWQRKANYNAIKKLSGAIVLSNSLKKIFEGMIDDDRIFVVENCVDDQYLLTDQEIEEKLKALENEKVLHVLWLSNFIRSKGYSFVLEMAKAEKERVDAGGEKRFHFDFAGKFFEDSEKDYFKSYIKENGLEEYVTYHGIVGGEQKRELLKKCYLFALPTRYPNEGQPISILEAMGNGMFIITTDHAGIPDIVEDGVNGIVMKNKENAYSKVASFKANELNFLNLEYISIDEVFSPYYTVTNAGCGASFIAEGYWNFGYFSVLFFIALGYVWGTLSNRFKQLCNSKYVKPENFFVIVYLMYYMIFLVRSESIELGRSFVYYAVIPILISKLLKTKTVRGGVRQAKEWLAYVHSYIDSIPQKLCDAVSYCYLFEREVAV